MWTPKPHRKWSLPQLTPLSASDRRRRAESKLFQPYQCGRLKLRRRSWVPAMVPWRASPEGEVTHEVLDWYERFAAGRPGAIVVEATGIRDVPSGPLLRIGHERFVPGLRKIVERVRRASAGETRLYIQLIDFLAIRRRPAPERYFREFLTIDARLQRAVESEAGRALRPSELREFLLGSDDATHQRVLSERAYEALAFGARQRVDDLEVEEIRQLPLRLPRLFSEAACRAERAGFDGVELHYAHAYTMASLLSARNRRDDGYGGDLSGRQRLPLEVLSAVRRAVRSDTVVGLRMLAEECIDGGSTVSEAESHALAFARAGVDFVSLSRGGKFEDAAQPKPGRAAYPYTGRSGYECMPTVRSDELGPFGRNDRVAGSIRQALRRAGHVTPIVVAGGVCSFSQAQALLENGVADVVAAARQSLADPDWFLKMELGEDQQIRRCEFTNYCEALDQRHEQVTCKLWDRIPGRRERRLVAPPWTGPREEDKE